MIQSLIDFTNATAPQIHDLFKTSLLLKKNFSSASVSSRIRGTAGLLFFEPSTRTRFSFQTACARQGIHPLVMDSFFGTSLEKGESVEDTIFNLAAMKPLFLIIRCSDLVHLKEIDDVLRIPVINAGWGVQGHPTQALLDALTLFEKWQNVEEKNILFIGDVKHSRVFNSHRQLAPLLGYRLGFCAPPEFSIERADDFGIRQFENIETALEWADAVVTLRVQNERHEEKFNRGGNIQDYAERYGINRTRAQILKKSGLILHPGPINYGVEIEKDVLADSRSVVLQLVENGVFIREVIIHKIISGEMV